MRIIKSKILSRFKELVHGVSRRDGIEQNAPFYFNLSFTVGDDPRKVERNRQIFMSELGIERVVFQNQTHSSNVSVVYAECNLHDNDALITDRKNLALAVSIADCVPILLFDTENKVIASVHSGWRGTEKGILSRTLLTLKNKFGTRPENIMAYIGPSICSNHYEVGSEVAAKFDKKYLREDRGKMFLDVALVNMDMLIDFGVPVDNIEKSNLCTFEENYLHSYRRDGKNSGRMLAVILLKGDE